MHAPCTIQGRSRRLSRRHRLTYHRRMVFSPAARRGLRAALDGKLAAVGRCYVLVTGKMAGFEQLAWAQRRRKDQALAATPEMGERGEPQPGSRSR